MSRKRLKRLSVDIDKTCSEEIIVRAKNTRDAKKKAWGIYINRKPKKKDHNIYCQELLMA